MLLRPSLPRLRRGSPGVIHLKIRRGAADHSWVTDSWQGPGLPFDATGGNRPAKPVEAVGPNGFLAAPAKAAGTPHHRGSRWAGDAVTLGRTGRIVATLVLFLPVGWLVYFMGISGLLFLGLYVFVFLPLALRDVWRRTRISLPPTPPPPRAP
jgi:hypothetical protein